MTIARGIDLPEAEIYRRYPVKELAVFGSAVQGVFQPLLAKHSKSFSLVDAISVGVDRMQRNFEPMRKQVETWRQAELSNVTAKLIIYQAFIEGELDVPKHLARRVHDCYFEPRYDEFNANLVEPIERLHVGVQGTGADSAAPGDGQTRRLSRSRFKQRSDRAGRIGPPRSAPTGRPPEIITRRRRQNPRHVELRCQSRP